MKKRIYELIMDYMKARKQEVSHYVQQIKDVCMVSFITEPNSLVKEVALQVLIKIIETFNNKEILEIINPLKLIT
jgi:Glu-tRNA(Gln) amidotransferase subunit E-like FAD-binding protein